SLDSCNRRTSAWAGSSTMRVLGEEATMARRNATPNAEFCAILVYRVSKGRGDTPFSRKPQAASMTLTASKASSRYPRRPRFVSGVKGVAAICLSDDVDEFARHDDHTLGRATFQEPFHGFMGQGSLLNFGLVGRAGHLERTTQLAVDL